MNISKITIQTVALAASYCTAYGLSFTPGDYYSSSYDSRVVTHFSVTGGVIDTYSFSSDIADSVRGIQFQNGSLYAVTEFDSGFNVLRLNPDYSVSVLFQSIPTYIRGNISYGKLAVTSNSIFVAGQDSLLKFNLDGSGFGETIFSDNQIFDAKVLPSGNLLVATAYAIKELTPNGALVRQIFPTGNSFTDLRGIEFDPRTGTIYATHLGHSGFSFQLMKVNYATGVIEDSINHWYGDDLFLTEEGNILVGSRTQAPVLFDTDFNPIITLGAFDQMFVTQATAIPEPASYVLVSGYIAAVAMLRRRRNRA